MRAFVVFVCLTTVRLFFRRIAVEGLDRVPTDRPLMVVANHPNGLMDPVVLRLGLQRELGFLAKSTLFENPVGNLAMSAFAAIPVFRSKDGNDTSKNNTTFDLVRDRLNQGGSMVIFPEGVSHSEPQLQRLKTGAARMCLHALDAENAREDLQILPVGLFYESKNTFRSRVAIAVGQPIDAQAWHARADAWEAAQDLTHTIAQALGDVVLEADSTELWTTLVAMAQWTHEDAQQDIAVARERAHRMADGFRRMVEESPEEANQVTEDVLAFRRMLESVGIDAYLELQPPRLTAGRLVRATLPLIVLAPVALVGALASWVPYRLIRPLSQKLAGGDFDIVSTIKAILGLVVMPLVYMIEASLVGVCFGWQAGLIAGIALPVAGFVALRWGELFAWRQDAMRGYWLRLTRRSVVEQALARRHELSVRIEAALLQYGS